MGYNNIKKGSVLMRILFNVSHAKNVFKRFQFFPDIGLLKVTIGDKVYESFYSGSLYRLVDEYLGHCTFEMDDNLQYAWHLYYEGCISVIDVEWDGSVFVRRRNKGYVWVQL